MLILAKLQLGLYVDMETEVLEYCVYVCSHNVFQKLHYYNKITLNGKECMVKNQF